ncbi:MAG: hypothetical protein HYY24_26655 [Verrucomicrobia bacterium]|nr:hypothetical protein [Verrucomicrobiota bacterium]
MKLRTAARSWSAATESAESPLWGGVAEVVASLQVSSAVEVKGVTSQTPSPHSKTLARGPRFMETETREPALDSFDRA